MTTRKPLRLWPGLLLAALIALLRFVVPLFVPDAMLVGIFAGLIGLVLVVLWWLFFSRAPWSERAGAIVLMAIAVAVTSLVLDPSISTGMMGRMFYFYAAPPTVAIAFVIWAAATRHLEGRLRWITMVVALIIGCGVWTLLRSEGIRGASAEMTWRWTPSAEQRLLAQAAEEPQPAPAAPAPADSPAPTPAATPELGRPVPGTAPATPPGPAPVDPTSAPAEWPGFRGPDRNSVVQGVRISTDWSAAPPKELWRKPIGPGWSSFAVHGDRIYTQEQRGEEELVSAYRLTSGAPIWRHREAARFWESNAGAGPRATPTLSGGRVFAFGATGILSALDASTGARIWSTNVATDTGKKVPIWGFSSSPVVVDGVVVVAAAGKLAAYDAATGKSRWMGPNGGGGYSSPQLMTIGGMEQIVFMSGAGAIGLNPADGKTLWEHTWEGTPIVQPAKLETGDLLISSADMMGGMAMRRLSVTPQGSTWNVQERWNSRFLKPYFNDFVVHEGHAYGFDGSILSCIDLETGERRWKGGRYGQGQFVLLPEQDLLIVLSEDGEVALVSATPDAHRELGKFKAIEGKTWNHPVVVRNLLLVRNGEEMAAFQLAGEGR